MKNNFDVSVLKQALDRVSDAIFIMSVEGKLVYANRQFCREYGVSFDEFEEEAYRYTDTMRTRAKFEAKLRELRENGGEMMYQAPFLNVPDGKQHIHQVNAFLINDGEEELVSFFMQDITNLVESQEEQIETNTLLNTILDNLPVYVFVKDVENDFRYVYWNKAFANYSQIPAEKVIGHTDFEVFPDYQDALKFREDDLTVLNTGIPIDRHETYMAADGKARIVQTQKILKQRKGKGPLLIGVSLDITNMQFVEEELVQERLRAEESDRLKSAFLANMSHEIRTPLNAIVGFSELLLEDLDSDSRKVYADIIRQNSDILLQLINDILDLSKIEAGTLEYTREPFDLDDMFNNLYEMNYGRVHGPVWLLLDKRENQERIMLNEDRNRVMQVITNLLNNAIKFTKEGEIRFGYTMKNDFIEVYVKDTGIGIAPEKKEKIFDRFVKLDSFAQGTGLGLSICKQIVDMIGGQLTVESEVGCGSTFRFTIPFEGAREVEVPTETVGSKPKLEIPSRRTILVAEDVFSNYKLVEAYLGKHYRLLWAKNGEDAIRLFKEEKPALILMDLKMPVMDGLECTRIIRRSSISIPIIAVSAFAFQTDKKKAFEAGVNDYITKPVTESTLLQAVRKYLI